MSKAKAPTELPLFDLPLHANDESEEEREKQIDLPLAEREGEREKEKASRFPRPVEERAKAPVKIPAAPKAAAKKNTPIEPEGASSTAAENVDGEALEDDAEQRAPLRDHLASGCVDFGIQLLFLGVAVGSVHAMGIRVGLGQWAPFTVLGLVFSFLYWFIPLAFWGQTPGMAWVGNVAVGKSGEPLTFGQTALRWCGALLTLLFAGLPVLLTLTGGSLSDRLSESRTWVV